MVTIVTMAALNSIVLIGAVLAAVLSAGSSLKCYKGRTYSKTFSKTDTRPQNCTNSNEVCVRIDYRLDESTSSKQYTACRRADITSLAGDPGDGPEPVPRRRWLERGFKSSEADEAVTSLKKLSQSSATTMFV